MQVSLNTRIDYNTATELDSYLKKNPEVSKAAFVDEAVLQLLIQKKQQENQD